MYNETIVPLEPRNRAERNVRSIILSILTDFGFSASGGDLSKMLPDYQEADNYVVVDDWVIRICAIEELAISTNLETLKTRVVKRLQAELVQALGPVAELLAS